MPLCECMVLDKLVIHVGRLRRTHPTLDNLRHRLSSTNAVCETLRCGHDFPINLSFKALVITRIDKRLIIDRDSTTTALLPSRRDMSRPSRKRILQHLHQRCIFLAWFRHKKRAPVAEVEIELHLTTRIRARFKLTSKNSVVLSASLSGDRLCARPQLQQFFGL